MKAKAMVFTEVGKPFEAREFPLVDLESKAIWVKVSMSTICGSDLHTIQGHRPAPVPMILGHEITGKVMALGKDIKTDTTGKPLKEGDRITWTIFANCGNCYYCKIKGLPMKCVNLFKYGHETCVNPPYLNGGYAEYCYITPGTYVFKVPDNLSDEEVAPVNCGLSTVIQGYDSIKIQPDDQIVIQGAGMLGLYAAAVAKERGAGKVIVIDLVDSRLEMAKKFGADMVINGKEKSNEEIIEIVRSSTGGWGVDLVVELAGTPKVIPMGIKMLCKGGRYLHIGNVSPMSLFEIDGNDIVTNWITIKGIHNYDALQLYEALNFIERNKEVYPFKDFVTHKVSLDEINNGIKIAESRVAIRVAVCP